MLVGPGGQAPLQKQKVASQRTACQLELLNSMTLHSLRQMHGRSGSTASCPSPEWSCSRGLAHWLHTVERPSFPVSPLWAPCVLSVAVIPVAVLQLSFMSFPVGRTCSPRIHTSWSHQTASVPAAISSASIIACGVTRGHQLLSTRCHLRRRATDHCWGRQVSHKLRGTRPALHHRNYQLLASRSHLIKTNVLHRNN
jgi:hypothetical protein